MISSNVVISHDYFKYAIANVQNILGGRLTSYESVVERARREAIVRLKLEAEKSGRLRLWVFGSAPLNSVCKVAWWKSLLMALQSNNPLNPFKHRFKKIYREDHACCAIRAVKLVRHL